MTSQGRAMPRVQEVHCTWALSSRVRLKTEKQSIFIFAGFELRELEFLLPHCR